MSKRKAGQFILMKSGRKEEDITEQIMLDGSLEV
jgi:hypothetical protein